MPILAGGVEAFFVISAFFLVRKHWERKDISVEDQFKHRITRLYPPYIAVLIVAALYALLRRAIPYDLVTYLLSAQNFHWMFTGYQSVMQPMTAHTWTLSIEVWGGIVWLLLLKLSSKDHFKRAMLVALLIGITYRVITIICGANVWIVSLCPLAHFDAFACGSLLAMGIKEEKVDRKVGIWGVLGLIGIVGCIAWMRITNGISFVNAYQLLSSSKNYLNNWFTGNIYLFISLLTTGIVGLVYVHDEKKSDAIGKLEKAFVKLGDNSYVLYLFHWPILVVLHLLLTGFTQKCRRNYREVNEIVIPLFKPYVPEIPELDTILHSGALAYGNYTKQFEEKLRDYFGTPHLIVTNSFNTAISVALTTLDILPGDDVIVSPMACLASTQPYLSSGLNVRWADVDPQIGTLSPDSVRMQITKNTKAIVHNHFCGYPGYIDEINTIGREHGIPVIDDGIECFGSEYKDRKIGNCGTDVTIFSLTAVRFCNCIDGGVVIFKDKDLYEKSLLVRDCGIDRSRFRDELGEITPDCDISMVGYSATMSNVNGYIGLKQLEKISELIIKHRAQADKWRTEYSFPDSMFPIYRENCNPNYWVFGLLTSNKRETIQFFRNNGYYASGVHIRNDIYSAFGKQEVDLSGVDKFYRSFVALPCGWWME